MTSFVGLFDLLSKEVRAAFEESGLGPGCASAWPRLVADDSEKWNVAAALMGPREDLAEECYVAFGALMEAAADEREWKRRRMDASHDVWSNL